MFKYFQLNKKGIEKVGCRGIQNLRDFSSRGIFPCPRFFNYLFNSNNKILEHLIHLKKKSNYIHYQSIAINSLCNKIKFVCQTKPESKICITYIEITSCRTKLDRFEIHPFHSCLRFFLSTKINNHQICFEKDKIYVHEFLALNTYLSSFLKTNQMPKYIYTSQISS